jgi:hypothetical protein
LYFFPFNFLFIYFKNRSVPNRKQRRVTPAQDHNRPDETDDSVKFFLPPASRLAEYRTVLLPRKHRRNKSGNICMIAEDAQISRIDKI